MTTAKEWVDSLQFDTPPVFSGGKRCGIRWAPVLGDWFTVPAAADAGEALFQSATALYGAGVSVVNDTLGRGAVLHCYDHAIKTLEAGHD